MKSANTVYLEIYNIVSIKSIPELYISILFMFGVVIQSQQVVRLLTIHRGHGHGYFLPFRSLVKGTTFRISRCKCE